MLFIALEWLKNFIASFGYAGIFVGSLIEPFVPPFPSEIVMGVAGFLIKEGRLSWGPVILVAVLGNFISMSLIWCLGRFYGRNFIKKWGRFVGISNRDVKKGERLFKKYGYKIVFAVQIVPLVRSWIAFPAGVLKTEYLKFILANAIGVTIWLSILCYIGYVLGENWIQIKEIVGPFENLIIIGLVIFVFVYIIRSFTNRKN